MPWSVNAGGSCGASYIYSMGIFYPSLSVLRSALGSALAMVFGSPSWRGHGVETEHGKGRPWTLDRCAYSMEQPVILHTAADNPPLDTCSGSILRVVRPWKLLVSRASKIFWDQHWLVRALQDNVIHCRGVTHMLYVLLNITAATIVSAIQDTLAQLNLALSKARGQC